MLLPSWHLQLCVGSHNVSLVIMKGTEVQTLGELRMRGITN